MIHLGNRKQKGWMKQPVVNLQIFSIWISSRQVGKWVWSLREKPEQTNGFKAMRGKPIRWTAKRKKETQKGEWKARLTYKKKNWGVM